tara:strand:- start:404 stop:511 length:108 start_codon:yes stop_codon:yes gene_type:complete
VEVVVVQIIQHQLQETVVLVVVKLMDKVQEQAVEK